MNTMNIRDSILDNAAAISVVIVAALMSLTQIALMLQ